MSGGIAVISSHVPRASSVTGRLAAVGGLLAASLASWAKLATDHAAPAIGTFCWGGAHVIERGTYLLQSLFLLNSPMHLAAHWAVMLVAMMAPVVIQPVSQLLAQDTESPKFLDITLLVGSYLTVWMLAGIVLVPAAFLARSSGIGIFGSVALAIGLAIAWHYVPLKRVCLEGCAGICHVASNASLEPIRSGAFYGCCCVGAGWPLMFGPSMISGNHLMAMIVATIWMAWERLVAFDQVNAPCHRSPRTWQPSLASAGNLDGDRA